MPPQRITGISGEAITSRKRCPRIARPRGLVDAPREIRQRSSRPGGGVSSSQPSSKCTSGTIASTKGIRSLRPSDVVICRSLPPLIRSLTVPTAGLSTASRASSPSRSSRHRPRPIRAGHPRTPAVHGPQGFRRRCGCQYLQAAPQTATCRAVAGLF